MKLLLALVFSLLTLMAGPLQAAEPNPRAAQVETMLKEVSAWLNSAWAAQYPHEPFVAQPLSMSNANFLKFARGRFRPEHQSSTGVHGLSAFYEERGFINGRPAAICYLLFNPERLNELETQFYLLDDADSQMAASLFLVAHEAGHCLDQRLKTRSPSGLAPEAHARWGEFGADIFAGLATLEVSKNRDLMQKIALKRRHGGVSHSTEPGINELLLLSEKNRLPSGLFIKDLWNLADNIRKKSFQ